MGVNTSKLRLTLALRGGVVNDQVREGFQSHLFHREGVAQNIFLKCHLTAQVQER
jgi:hypothetical protein